MKGIKNMGIKSLIQNKKEEKGFTIIEVVLVLAIAGLIFLMVFIALPGMQRSQRDTQRRDDYAALSTSVTNFMTNNNGRLPTTDAQGTCRTNFRAVGQINQEGNDPDGRAYQLECYSGVPTDLPGEYVRNNEENAGPRVLVITGARCEGGVPTSAQGQNRAFVVYGQLESGTYCNASS